MIAHLLITIASLLIYSSSKLYQVVAVFSPGARYHLNDLYDGKQTISLWGQITPVGLKQMENLGKITRKQYIEKIPFLDREFQAQEVEIYSTSFNRSIMSSLAHLYGTYSLGNGLKLEPAQIKYHFPPYIYNNETIQNIFSLPFGQLLYIVKSNKGMIENCLNEQVEIQKNIKQQLAEYNEMILTYSPFLKQMANMFKITSSQMNFKKLADLYDTISVDRYLARPLPSQFQNQQLANIQHLYNWYHHFTMTFNLSRAYSTFKINKIIQNFQNIIKNPTSNHLKWTTLSVDLKDIFALQNDLNISSARCIEQLYRKGSTRALNCQQSVSFASSLIFQLHSDNQKDFYVLIRNNGKKIYPCQQNSTSCLYQAWKSRISKILINTEPICGKVQDHYEAMKELDQTIVVLEA